jgi:hypothetical protein
MRGRRGVTRRALVDPASCGEPRTATDEWAAHPVRVRREADNGRGRWAFALTVASFVWGLALVGAAFVVPVYSVEEGGGSGEAVTTTSTLVDVNGLGVLVPVALPAAIVVLVWFALHGKCSRGTSRSGGIAWVLIGFLATFCLLAAFSIGMFVVPVALLLAAAAAFTPHHST